MNTRTWIEEAILRYVEGSDPEYALMIDGDWGCGKTFFWKDKIVPYLNKKEWNPLYISLYGIENLKEIDSQILYALHPLMQNKAIKIGGKFLQIFLKKNNASQAEDLLPMLINLGPKLKKSVLCFDDLERVGIKDISSVLGYINRYVEHENIRVIIIANEKEILEKEDKNYSRIKEKLIGHTYKYSPNTGETIKGLIQARQNEADVFDKLIENSENIIKTFESSKHTNIRTAKHVIDHTIFILRTLNLEKISDKNITYLLIKLISSITIEAKLDVNKARSLLKLFSDKPALYWMFYVNERNQADPDDNSNYLINFIEQYFDGNLDLFPIIPSVLPLIIDGTFDLAQFKSEVMAELENLNRIEKPIEEKILNNFWELSEEEILESTEKLITEINQLKVRSPYRLLLIFNTLMYCSTNSLIALSKKDLIQKFEKCVGDLDEARQLLYEELLSSDFGSFIDQPTQEVINFREYLINIGQRYKKEIETKELKELFELLKRDPKEFTSAISNFDYSAYASTPIFDKYEPADFVSIIQNLEAKDIMLLKRAFESRYMQVSNSNDYLGSEYANLVVIQQILSRALDTHKNSLKKVAIQQLIQKIEEVTKKLTPKIK